MRYLQAENYKNTKRHDKITEKIKRRHFCRAKWKRSHQSKCKMAYLSDAVVGQMKCHRQNVRLNITSVVHVHKHTQLTVCQHKQLVMKFLSENSPSLH